MVLAQYEALAHALEQHCAQASEGVLAEARALRERLHKKHKKESQKLRRAQTRGGDGGAFRYFQPGDDRRVAAATASCHCRRASSRSAAASCIALLPAPQPSPSRSPSLRRQQAVLASKSSSAAVATAACSRPTRCSRCHLRRCRRGCATCPSLSSAPSQANTTSPICRNHAHCRSWLAKAEPFAAAHSGGQRTEGSASLCMQEQGRLVVQARARSQKGCGDWVAKAEAATLRRRSKGGGSCRLGTIARIGWRKQRKPRRRRRRTPCYLTLLHADNADGSRLADGSDEGERARLLGALGWLAGGETDGQRDRTPAVSLFFAPCARTALRVV
eukprot:scaffold59458_cov64-Phaeocystis_antarctica.AAC.4